MPTRTLLEREPLLIVLAASAGAVDAISFLTFDVFTANMTGNVVLLGLALSARAGAEAVRAAVALAGFTVGVMVAARAIGRARTDRPAGAAPAAAEAGTSTTAAPASWRPRVTATIGATLALQLVFAAGWLIADGSPTGGGRDVLVAVSALAMGAQSAAVASLGLPNVATTYVTGTLTGLLGSLATGTRASVDLLRVGVIVGLALGATAGALLVSHAREIAPLLPAALTVTVIAAVVARARR